ncbi:MAG: LEA type 2 family protein [Paludibacteraceae bacterium]|nr:LEA type 2 family protein [Paludibacteraceae bacterium]
MKKVILLVLAVLAVVAFFYFRTAKNFVNCEFKFGRVSNVVLADVDITHVDDVKKLSFKDAAKLLSAAGSGKLDMDLTVELLVKNPNEEPAHLDGIDYLLYIDDKQVAEGSLEQKVSIQPQEEQTVVLPCKVDLQDILTSDKLESIADFAFGLANNNVDANRLKVSLKPYFTIAGETVKFPSYITVKGETMLGRK